jgi:acetyltransferase-like isoleucine patch superfamily enzyme
MKKYIRRLFNLRDDIGINFYITDFIFRKILRQNSETTWAIHFTSKIIHPEKIKRGINVYPGDSKGVYIEASNGVTIGDYTNIAPNVGILSADHNLIDNTIVEVTTPINIGKFCWLGMNCVILPGVVLGDFTVVGAGAVVTKSFPNGYCVIGGVPAQILKLIDKNDCKIFEQSKN